MGKLTARYARIFLVMLNSKLYSSLLVESMPIGVGRGHGCGVVKGYIEEKGGDSIAIIR